ncbi:Rv3654c family TadE-like protein [Micromonospora sp. NBC_01412]|uniref:Rv3654c family TadE-like protein n=1 Tax=Micromonospora sp. NBC_01412 TaxID=2903590 RepID=UPI00386EE6A1
MTAHADHCGRSRRAGSARAHHCGRRHRAGRPGSSDVQRRGAGTPWAGRERGGATVCLLAVGLVFVVVGLFGAAVGAARVARQQVRVAADFGALAGASRALAGEQVACSSADEVVRANGARLTGCRLDGLDAVVTAEVTVTPVPGLTRVATVTSRAGPVRA